MVMFTETIQNVHHDITEQSASQLCDFLVTAMQRYQTDSKVLSMGLQMVKQEILDEGYDWSDLITILVNLLGSDMQEEQHRQFVADLDRLYAVNASLLEVGSVMASGHPTALEELELLIEEAQKEHEELAGIAGGTSNHHTSSWKPDKDRTKGEKAEAIGKDTGEVVAGGLVLGAIGLAGYLGYKVHKSNVATKAEDVRIRDHEWDQRARFNDDRISLTASHLSSSDVSDKRESYGDGGHDKSDELKDMKLRFMNASKEFDFRGYARHEFYGYLRSTERRDIATAEQQRVRQKYESGEAITRDEKYLLAHTMQRYDGVNLIYDNFGEAIHCRRAIAAFKEFEASGLGVDEWANSKGKGAHRFRARRYMNQEEHKLWLKSGLKASVELDDVEREIDEMLDAGKASEFNSTSKRLTAQNAKIFDRDFNRYINVVDEIDSKFLTYESRRRFYNLDSEKRDNMEPFEKGAHLVEEHKYTRKVVDMSDKQFLEYMDSRVVGSEALSRYVTEDGKKALDLFRTGNIERATAILNRNYRRTIKAFEENIGRGFDEKANPKLDSQSNIKDGYFYEDGSEDRLGFLEGNSIDGIRVRRDAVRKMDNNSQVGSLADHEGGGNQEDRLGDVPALDGADEAEQEAAEGKADAVAKSEAVEKQELKAAGDQVDNTVDEEANVIEDADSM